MLAQSRGGSSMPLLLTAVIVAIVAFMIVTFASTIKVDATANRVSDHGIAKHIEAKEIEDSCNRSVYQTWKDKREKKFYLLCKLSDDKWGIIPVVVSGGTEIWKTAFSPGSGCWSDAVKYLGTWATRYNGKIQ